MEFWPADVIKHIFSYTKCRPFCKLRETCKRLHNLTKDKVFTRKFEYSQEQPDPYLWAVKYQHIDILYEFLVKDGKSYIWFIINNSIRFSSYKVMEYICGVSTASGPVSEPIAYHSCITEYDLHTIIKKRDIEMLKIVLANTNLHVDGLLMRCIRKELLEYVKVIFTLGKSLIHIDEVSSVALDTANIDIIDYLHKKGYFTIKMENLEQAINKQKYALLSYLLDNYQCKKQQVIHLFKIAIKKHESKAIKCLFDKYKINNKDRETLISLATEEKSWKIVNILKKKAT